MGDQLTCADYILHAAKKIHLLSELDLLPDDAVLDREVGAVSTAEVDVVSLAKNQEQSQKTLRRAQARRQCGAG
jgi:hypothetical protein